MVQNNASLPKAGYIPCSKFSLWLLIKYWLPVLSYAILIFYLSSFPGQDLPFLFAYQDIAFHVIEYAGFALLINRALKARQADLVYAKRIFWVFFLSLIYAALDEWHQSFVPNRIASVKDFAFDALGVFISSIFYR